MINFEDVIIDSDGVEVKIKGKKRNKIAKKITAVMPLLSTLTFLILGFCFNLWHPGWVVFLSIPLTGIIIGLFNKRGKALWISLITIICVIVYLLLGFILQAWHPGWLIFFAIPIAGIIIE